MSVKLSQDHKRKLRAVADSYIDSGTFKNRVVVPLSQITIVSIALFITCITVTMLLCFLLDKPYIVAGYPSIYVEYSIIGSIIFSLLYFTYTIILSFTKEENAIVKTAFQLGYMARGLQLKVDMINKKLTKDEQINTNKIKTVADMKAAEHIGNSIKEKKIMIFKDAKALYNSALLGVKPTKRATIDMFNHNQNRWSNARHALIGIGVLDKRNNNHKEMDILHVETLLKDYINNTSIHVLEGRK